MDNLTDSISVGHVRLCSVYSVTYYWDTAAKDAHLYSNIAVATTNIVLSLLGMFANALLIAAFVRNPRLRSLHHMPLVALACSDLLVTSFVQPLYVARLLKETVGSHNCLLWALSRLASYFSCGISLLTVTFISIERYIVLAYPLRHQTIITSIRVRIVVASIWLATFALVISHLYLIGYTVFLSVGAAVLLLCIMTMISIWVWIHRLINRHRSNIEASQIPANFTNGTLTRNQVFRNTRTSYFIVTAVLICYLPALLVMAYFSTQPNNFVLIFVVEPWPETLGFANAFLNPLLVLWRKSDFRETVRGFLL